MRIPEIYLLGGTLQSLKIPKVADVGEPKVGSLGVNADLVLCEYNGGGNWSPLVDMGEDLYEFTTQTFLGVSNDWSLAPTLNQCATAYTGKPFIGDLTLFNCIEGVQVWTVPSNGTYRIVLRGGSNFNRGGGVDITTVLGKEDKLRLVVGRSIPGYNSRIYNGYGASVVYSDALGLLAVAAGSGGSSGSPVTRDTEVTVDNPGSGFGGGGSSYGSSSNGTFGGGGAGFLSDGQYSNPYTSYGRKANRVDPRTVLPGLGGQGSSKTSLAGSQWSAAANGAFGGGGGSAAWTRTSTTASCGGGAGYTGGASASGYSSGTPNVSAFPGTNYAASNLISRSAFSPPQYSDGQIIITKLS